MKFKNILSKFTDWLKYFSLNFFHNKYARAGAKRSTLNVLLGVVIAYVLICGGLTIGYNASFGAHYENADKFRQFAYSALKDTSLEIRDGKLNADKLVETLSEDKSGDRVNGYVLVVDTRPADGAYDDFEIICTDKNDKSISYKEFESLPAADKNNYSLQLKLSGKTLDTAAKQDEYRAYLDEVSNRDGKKYIQSVAESYASIKERESAGALTGYDLYNEVYKLYAHAYYPSFEKVERYASVPTLRSYYLSEVSEKKYGKYLLLFDDYCFCSFITDGGVGVSFSGEYGVADGALTDIDGMFKSVFKSNSATNFLVFASNMVVSLVIFVIIMLLTSLICAQLLKGKGIDYGKGSSGLFTVLGGFLPVSGLIAFLFGIAIPYATTVQTAFLAVRLIFLCTVLIRFAVLIAMDAVAAKRKKPVSADAAAEPVDPFAEDYASPAGEPASDNPEEVSPRETDGAAPEKPSETDENLQE